MESVPTLFLTFLIRLSFIALHAKLELPAWFRTALTFVPVTVLSAITLPEILVWNGELFISLMNPRLLAGVAAFLVAWRTKNVWATIIVGMAVLLGVQFLIK